MTGERILRTVTAAALALAMVFTSPAEVAPAGAASLSDLQQKQAGLKQKSKELDSQIEKLKNDKAKQQQYKDALDAKIVNLEQQIDDKTTEVRQLDADILQKQEAIAGKQKKIDADFQQLKQRVYALYLTGEASNLEIVLNAKNVMDLANKTELLQVISEHDTGLINSLKSDLESVKTQKEAIEKNRKAASDAKTSLQQDDRQLTELSNESAKLIATMSQTQKQDEDEQAQCRIDQKSAQAAVDAWLANYYASQKKSSGGSSGRSSGRSSGGSAGGASGGSAGEALSIGQVSAILSVARRYLGCSYQWGGSAPPAFDCSGYVSYVLKQSGWSLGGASRLGVDGLSSYCSPVSYSEARPGDLVFYNYTYGGLPNSHVGIYLGDGMAIQCDSPGVEYVSLGSSYWQSHLAGFGRLP